MNCNVIFFLIIQRLPPLDTEAEKKETWPEPESELEAWPEVEPEAWPEPEPEPEDPWAEPEDGWNADNERESIDKWQAERKQTRKGNLVDIWNDVGKDDWGEQKREEQPKGTIRTNFLPNCCSDSREAF